MTQFFDAAEHRARDEREQAIFERLPRTLALASERAPAWRERFGDIDLRAIRTRADLRRLPVTRKSDLMAAQEAAPPFGGFLVIPESRLVRAFASPGPVFVPQGPEPDPWRAARALHAAGVRPGEVVANTFGYHMTPGAFILESGLRALGCPVIAAGAGNTDQQVSAFAALRPTVYCGVPDYLNILLERAEAACLALSFTKALVSGAALPASLRKTIEARGVVVSQCYATADLGVIAYESGAREGLILNEDLILEIVRPGTGEPVKDGEVGEVVVTRFCATYPMFRLATGDLSAIMPGVSPCGRTNTRIRGFMGRADQRTKVKGMFVDPVQIAAVLRAHPQIAKARLVVTREREADAMTLKCEGLPADAAEGVAATLKAQTNLSGTVEPVEPGTLPNDGKVIADERPLDG